MEKFGRTYDITFNIGVLENSGALDKVKILESIIVSYPLTANFAISRNTYSQVNTAFVSILGLAQDTRDRLYKDRYDMETYIEMEIRAGYQDEMSLIFKGTIKECQSYKDSGATEYRTDIEAWDGGLAVYKGNDNNSFSAGTSTGEILETLCHNMPNIKVGAISPDFYNKTLLRPEMFGKKTYDDLSMLTDGDVFIDSEKIYFLKTNDVIDGDIDSLLLGNTLLGSPRRKEGIVTIETIFEPRIIIGQQIEILSETVPYLSGSYKILGVSHDGVISGAKGGSMITTIDLFIGTEKFRRVKKKNV